MGVSYHIGQHRYRSLLKTLYWFHEFFSTYCLIFLIFFQANFQELFLCTLSSFLSSSAYSRLTSVIISPLKFLCSGLSVIFTYQIHLIGNLLASLMILDHCYLPVYPLWLAYETHMLVFILPHTLPYFFFLQAFALYLSFQADSTILTLTPFGFPDPVCVHLCVCFLMVPAGCLRIHSILVPSDRRQHYIPQVKGSILPDYPPFSTPDVICKPQAVTDQLQMGGFNNLPLRFD